MINPMSFLQLFLGYYYVFTGLSAAGDGLVPEAV